MAFITKLDILETKLGIPETKLDIPEPEEFRWLIDLPRPRQVKKQSPWRYTFFYVAPVAMVLAMLADGDLNFRAAIVLTIIFLAIAVLIFLVNPDRSARLLASGNLTFGKVVGVEREDGDEEISWRVDCKFRDSRGTVHTAAYKYADEGEWQGQVGDVLPIFYDSSNPSRNYLLLDRGMHLTPETPTYSMRGCGGLPADAGGV